jgi:hypothetical protein
MNHIKLLVLSIGLLALAIGPVSATGPEVNTSSAQETKPEKRNINLFEDCINHHVLLFGESYLRRTMIEAYHADKSYEEIKKEIKQTTVADQDATMLLAEKALKHCFGKASR